MKRLAVLMAVLALVVVQGCATMADARYARGEGQSQVFNAPFDTVWKAVPQALASLGLPVAADNKQDGYILAERGITAFSWGEKVAVFVDRAGDNRTKVEVVSKRAMATNVLAPDWGPEVLQRVEQVLQQSK